MRISGLSEQKLVVVLFIMVIVTFFFAQADTNKIEKMYLNNNPSVTTWLGVNQYAKEGTKTKETSQFIPAAQLP